MLIKLLSVDDAEFIRRSEYFAPYLRDISNRFDMDLERSIFKDEYVQVKANFERVLAKSADGASADDKQSHPHTLDRKIDDDVRKIRKLPATWRRQNQEDIYGIPVPCHDIW